MGGLISSASTALSCPKCGWSKTVVPQSDVLLEGHTWFTVCPECGNSKLDHKKANIISSLAAQAQQSIEHWRKK